MEVLVFTEDEIVNLTWLEYRKSLIEVPNNKACFLDPYSSMCPHPILDILILNIPGSF
jgi:hypothetical protein